MVEVAAVVLAREAVVVAPAVAEVAVVAVAADPEVALAAAADRAFGTRTGFYLCAYTRGLPDLLQPLVYPVIQQHRHLDRAPLV